MEKPGRVKTMDDIARLANVSKPTVSRALRNSPLVTEETKRRVLEVAAEHGYVVNRHAQKLRRSRTDTIAVALDFSSHRENRISDPFIFNLLAGVAEALATHEQDLLLFSPGHSHLPPLRTITSAKGVDGIIFLGQGARGDELLDLATSAVPFVVWGAAGDDLPYVAVGGDNVEGGRLAGEYLVGKGRRRLLFVGDCQHMEIAQRRQGLAKACTGVAGIELLDLGLDDFSYEASYEAAQRFIATRQPMPDGIFCCSDTAAMAFISAFRDHGVIAGRDINIVGYNDIPEAAHFYPALTTIHQDVRAAGALLVEKLMRMIAGDRPRPVMLEAKLVVRQS